MKNIDEGSIIWIDLLKDDKTLSVINKAYVVLKKGDLLITIIPIRKYLRLYSLINDGNELSSFVLPELEYVQIDSIEGNVIGEIEQKTLNLIQKCFEEKKPTA